MRRIATLSEAQTVEYDLIYETEHPMDSLRCGHVFPLCFHVAEKWPDLPRLFIVAITDVQHHSCPRKVTYYLIAVEPIT